jgi:cellobiose phosphorylase
MIDWTLSEDSREFILRTPYTPRPWINYLTNGQYFALVSQTGGGFSFYLDPSHHVVTRREQDMLLNDRPGRFVFIQDLDDNDFWNIGGSPSLTPLDEYTCRHGFGYTEIASKRGDIEGSVAFFVPSDKDVEVWLLRVRNLGTRARRLRILAYQEFVLGNSLIDPIARRFDSFFKHARIDAGVVLAGKSNWNLRGARADGPWEYDVFSTATRVADRIWLDKEEFMGRYRDLARPRALENPEAKPTQTDQVWGTDLIGAHEWQLNLAAGDSIQWELLTGIAPTGAGVELAQSLASSDRLLELRDSTRKQWQERVTRISVKTPDEPLDQLTGGWTPYQILIKSYLSSAPSYYHASDGSPGFRDAMQDAFGLCLLEPDRARELVLRLASFQFSDGTASHRAPRIALPPERTEKSDLPLWISLAALQYVRESGDTSIILEEVRFADGPDATILDHIRAGLDRSLQDVGRRGLPLIHYGDWNDALDGLGGEGKGESVFLGQFLAYALANSAKLAQLVGEHDHARTWIEKHDQLVKIINRDCWDEDRFVRAFHDDGTVIGCRENREGRLYLNPQVWAVLADAAPRERLVRCMDSVHRELDSPFGIRCLAPPYSLPDPHVGLISRFPPGVKENGAVFSHAMAFCVVAELMLGRADLAWELIQKANPLVRAKSHPDYAMEPYVYCQFVAGPETNLRGQGFHHWLTGTCSWMQYAVINWLLGARAELDGLVVDPCIPSHWRGFELVRPYRGSTLHITVENPHGKSKGVKRLRVDGREVTGNRVPPPGKNRLEIYAVIE